MNVIFVEGRINWEESTVLHVASTIPLALEWRDKYYKYVDGDEGGWFHTDEDDEFKAYDEIDFRSVEVDKDYHAPSGDEEIA